VRGPRGIGLSRLDNFLSPASCESHASLPILPRRMQRNGPPNGRCGRRQRQSSYDFRGASRQARSYAFLYAAFKGKDTPHSNVRDVVDCLIPFIAAYTNGIPGRQVDLTALQKFLRTTFGFDIPIYALQQLLPSLRTQGYIEFKRGHNIDVAIALENNFLVAREDIVNDFDEIATILVSYANKIGFSHPPPSGSWESAITRFLKPYESVPERKVIKIHNILIDARNRNQGGGGFCAAYL